MEKNKNETGLGLDSYETFQPHKEHKPKLAAINKWLKDHWKIVLPAVIGFILLVSGGVYFLLRSPKATPEAAVKQAAAKPATPQKFYSPLTGSEVSEADAKRPVTAVIVENSPDARPQSGLADAGVVFESVAEAGITRFMILFQETRPGLIGPVRSVRPQFASLVAAFDAGLGHVGGSDIPLQKLRSGQIKDLDQFFNAGSYYRASDRYAPHNVYTSDDRLQSLNSAKGYNGSTFTAWTRKKTSAPSPTPTGRSIEVPVSTGLYAVHYDWDQASNSYLRSEGGQPHNDREKGRIAPKVVVAMQVPHDVIRDSNGYSYPDVNNSGKAWVFQDGVVSEITWAKAGDKDPIKFTDSTGKPFEFSPGQTWISLIRPDRAPTWQ